MRVRLDDGKTVIRLKHFTYTAEMVALLNTIQRLTPNLELLATGPTGGPVVMPAFRLRLDRDELLFLNPAMTA